MGSNTDHPVAPRIPVISLCGDVLSKQADDWKSACREMRRALEEYGWFELVYENSQQPSSTEEVLHSSVVHDAMEEVFSLPRETKMKNKSPNLGQGYTGQSTVLPNLHYNKT